jgi:hypothetical protein
LKKIVVTVVCEGLDHRLEFRGDGEIVMLDHSEKLVRSFVAFGAKPPSCMEEIDRARERPIEFLISHLDIDTKVLALLSCDFAEHVLPIWYEYYKDDDRPKKAIQASRKYLAGKIKLSTLERAGAAAARAAAEAALAEASAAAEVASAAARAASGAERAAWDAERAAWAAAREAAWAAYRHAEAHGNDPDEAMAAERKWQLIRMIHEMSVS